MRMPLRPSLLKLRRTGVRFIIIHHTIGIYDNPSTYIDNTKFQTPSIVSGVLEKKQGDINYNFLVEKIKEDYYCICARPFPFLCQYDDIIPSVCNASIHIGVMGNFDLVNPPPRLYDILAYRLINPLLHMFHLSTNKIKFHSEVSTKKTTCPGVFFNKEKLVTMVKKFVLR